MSQRGAPGHAPRSGAESFIGAATSHAGQGHRAPGETGRRLDRTTPCRRGERGRRFVPMPIALTTASFPSPRSLSGAGCASVGACSAWWSRLAFCECRTPSELKSQTRRCVSGTAKVHGRDRRRGRPSGGVRAVARQPFDLASRGRRARRGAPCPFDAANSSQTARPLCIVTIAAMTTKARRLPPSPPMPPVSN